MGIAGHILGEKKMRKLNRETGMNFDRAFNRNGQGVGRVLFGATDTHYAIDFTTYEIAYIDDPTHWTSCPKRLVATL